MNSNEKKLKEIENKQISNLNTYFELKKKDMVFISVPEIQEFNQDLKILFIRLSCADQIQIDSCNVMLDQEGIKNKILDLYHKNKKVICIFSSESTVFISVFEYHSDLNDLNKDSKEV